VQVNLEVFWSLSLDGGAGLHGSAALTPPKEIFGTRLCELQSESTLSGEGRNILSVLVQ